MTLENLVKKSRNIILSGLLGIAVACGPDNTCEENCNNNVVDAGYVDAGKVDSGSLDSGYDAGSVDAGCDCSVDGGLDSGYDGGVENLAPVAILEAEDEQGNSKTTFRPGEFVVYKVDKSYDPDCQNNNMCGDTKGIDYCEWKDNTGNSGFIVPGSKRKQSYNAVNPLVIANVKCYELENKLFGEASININIQNN